MEINLKFKSLIAVALLSCFSSIATVSAVESADRNNSLAPEVSAAEAKLSFRDIPDLKKAFIDTTPAARKGDLAVGELGIDGGNKNMIVKLAEELADNKHGEYDSLLIAHKGKFLFESYYKRGRINLPHFQNSATKGYASLLLGRAIQLGYLTMADLDKPLVSFLKGLDPTKFVDGVDKITLHQALTMRSGLRFSDEQMTKFRGNSEIFKGLAQVQAFLELSEPVTSMSQVYKYQGPDPIMVMQVLDAVVPGSAKDFIKNEFFGKLGITNYKWKDDKSGLPIGDGRLSMTSRDMLKLGVLVTDEGQWKGEQLLSADYLAKATSAITRATEDWQEPETFFYGYLWYQTDVAVGDKSYDVKIAWGGGGNRVISVEALDLVVVITGLDMEDKIFTQVSKTILPAFVN
ncbi:serine hydrolase domain-containing protein [Colwellia piezophila]|uniref:serine hydrolase domain-containing protein n=1 Tax=Colwellia piezophila TaxID=211668 RepID=UPI000377AF7D|nr:serine hydrolase [Colwellia piezophila]